MVVYDFLDMEYDWSSDKTLFQDYKFSEMKFKNTIEIVEFAVGELFRASKDIELLQVDETKDKDVRQLIQMMNELILDPNNYIYDFYAVCYMSILYNDPKNRIIVNELDPVCRKQMHKAINSAAGKNRSGQDTMHRLTGSAYELYPVPLYYNDIVHRLVMIPGGCKEYHKQVIHTKYFGFYNMSKDNESQEYHTRHSYTKIQNLWDCLRKSKIENLLMMEYNLGSGCACYLFEKLSWIQTDSELFAWKDFIELIREFPYFFIRKQMLELVFGLLEAKQYYNMEKDERENLRNKVSQILKNAINILNSEYIKSLKLFSYLMWEEIGPKTKFFEIRDEEHLTFLDALATAWTGYYDNCFAYTKCVEPIIGKGWYWSFVCAGEENQKRWNTLCLVDEFHERRAGVPTPDMPIYDYYLGQRDFWKIGGALGLIVEGEVYINPVEWLDLAAGFLLIDLRQDDIEMSDFSR